VSLLGPRWRCGMKEFCEVDDLTCYDTMYGYIGYHGEMWDVQYCEVDDLGCFDAVWICMVSLGDIDISLIKHSLV